jgi:hypothetical protein
MNQRQIAAARRCAARPTGRIERAGLRVHDARCCRAAVLGNPVDVVVIVILQERDRRVRRLGSYDGVRSRVERDGDGDLRQGVYLARRAGSAASRDGRIGHPLQLGDDGAGHDVLELRAYRSDRRRGVLRLRSVARRIGAAAVLGEAEPEQNGPSPAECRCTRRVHGSAPSKNQSATANATKPPRPMAILRHCCAVGRAEAAAMFGTVAPRVARAECRIWHVLERDCERAREREPRLARDACDSAVPRLGRQLELTCATQPALSTARCCMNSPCYSCGELR